jgi:hypothetical protein
MTNKGKRDGDRRPNDRRDSQPDDEHQRRPGEAETQEGDSVVALKAILAKVAALLAPLKLTKEESISLVEQLYGGVLEMDLKLAGETDDKRKSSVLAYIKNTKITRNDGKIAVEYPADQESGKTDRPKSGAGPKGSGAKQSSAKPSPDKKDDASEPKPEPQPEATPTDAPAETPADAPEPETGEKADED